MIIIQKPEGLHFEKNIPDIILEKENDEVSVDITLKIGQTVILEENYKFDANGLITVRRLDEIVSAYLTAVQAVEGDNVVTTGLMQTFDVVLTVTGNLVLEHSGSVQNDQLLIGQENLPGYLSESLSVGDKLLKIVNTIANLLITHLNDQTNTITFDGNVDNFTSAGEFAYFETYRTDTLSFAVLKCEAYMPDSLAATDFVADGFLTRLPGEKRTYINNNEYLSILQKAVYDAVTVFCTVYFAGTTGEESESFALLQLSAAATDRIVTFNASAGVIIYAHLHSIPAITDKIIYRYSLYCTGAQYESQNYTFLVERTNYRNLRFFVFVNCFGVLETFTATGLIVNKKTNEFNLGNIENHYRKIIQDFVSEKTCNSGYLSEEEMEWIDDLVKSYTVGLYSPGTSGMSEEITLVGVDKTDTDANELQAFSFGYRRAKNNHLQFAAAAQGIFDDTFDETFN